MVSNIKVKLFYIPLKAGGGGGQELHKYDARSNLDMCRVMQAFCKINQCK